MRDASVPGLIQGGRGGHPGGLDPLPVGIRVRWSSPRKILKNKLLNANVIKFLKAFLALKQGISANRPGFYINEFKPEK